MDTAGHIPTDSWRIYRTAGENGFENEITGHLDSYDGSGYLAEFDLQDL